MTDTNGPLAGFRVLDMTMYVAGPLCTSILADMGADVIKLERPPTGDVYRRQGPDFVDGESISFLALNKGKRSIVLDVKHPKGRSVLDDLLRTSDAFVHNFKPTTVERLRLGKDDVAAISPQTIWAGVSGYGGLGPKGQEGGYDLMMQGECGLMEVTGYADRAPAKAGFAVVDITAGTNLALGITASLLERERTGEVRAIETSLYEISISMGTILAERYLATGKIPQRSGSASSLFAPYQAYATSDGYVTVEGTGPPGAWSRFCAAIEAAELEERDEFRDNASRVHHRDLLRDEVEARTSRRPTDYWIERFRERGLPCGPIQTIGQALESRQTRALDLVIEAEHPTLDRYRTVRTPVRRGPVRTVVQGAPLLGEHTGEVLEELGYGAAEIKALEGEQVAIPNSAVVERAT